MPWGAAVTHSGLMTQQTQTPALLSAQKLLVVTRRLAAFHAVVGVGLLGLAAWMFIAYAVSADEDNLAGVAIIFGVGFVILGAILLALSLGAMRSRTPGVAFGLGLASGLFLLVAAGPGAVLLLSSLPVVGPLLSVGLALVALAMVVSSFAGLVARNRS